MTLLVKLYKTMSGVLTPMADSTNCLNTNVDDGLSKIILAMVYILFATRKVPTVLSAKPGQNYFPRSQTQNILWPVRDVTLSCLVK